MGGVFGNGSAVAHRLYRETHLARTIIAETRSLVGDEADMIENAVEGETNLNEAMALAIERLAELETLMEASSELMQTLKARFDRFADQHTSLKEMLGVALEATGQRRFETPLATISLKRVPPKVEITNEADIPARFWKVPEPRLDKRAIADALKKDEAVPGCVLGNGGTSIQIKFG